jgi:diaminopimelate epimerase
VKRFEFCKYHGLGNDFVLIDRRGGGVPPGAAEAARLCDRHRGIGADGVLTILPSRRAPFRMHVRNADGSPAEMCGNGIRCVVKHAVERLKVNPSVGGFAARELLWAMGFDPIPGAEVHVYEVETGRGSLECAAELRGGRVISVAVGMGAAVLDRSRIPMRGTGTFVKGAIRAAGREFEGTAVGMGNPHLVLFHRDDADDARTYGPVLEVSPLFPKRANVEFARAVSPREIRAVVWERGVGLTKACGTGACAVAAAFALAGKAPFEEEVKVTLPGGTLGVAVRSDLNAVFMRGPAEFVFEGVR